MRKLLSLCAMSLMMLCVSSCATRTTVVLNTASDWVRITRPVKAHIATYQNGVWVESGVATLPAGWFSGPGAKPE